MNQPIPMDDYGIFCDGKDTARANSLMVAKMFGKNHRDVLKSIRELDCSKEFTERNFALSTYKDDTGRKRFNEMEKFIRTMIEARTQLPLLTDNIKLLHENPRPYHFSNECDMLNRIVIGRTAKQFRQEHGIPKGESIRPYLNAEQINMLDILQKVDIGLLVSISTMNGANAIWNGTN